MPKLNNAVIRIIYCSYHVTHHDSDMTFQHNLVSSSEINENPNDTRWLQIETSIILDNNIILDIFNPRKDDKKDTATQSVSNTVTYPPLETIIF